MNKTAHVQDTSFSRLQRELGKIISNASPGEKLLPEPKLARQLGVARSTLREAMRTFEAQGLLMRRQGAGTFVVEKSGVFETGLEVLESLETIANRSKLHVLMGGLEITEMTADKKYAALFDLPEGSDLVNVKRVIIVKNRPAAFLQDILPKNVLSQQDLEQGFTGSVLDLLIKRGIPMLEQSRTEIKAAAAESTEARALQIQRGDVLLLLEADLVTKEGGIIDHSYSFFLPGYFRLHVNRKIGII